MRTVSTEEDEGAAPLSCVGWAEWLVSKRTEADGGI